MKRLLVLVVLTFLALGAYADEPTAIVGVPGDTTTSFCEADDCGSLPPTEPNPTGGTQPIINDPCVKATDYTSCRSRCTCQYNEAYKKCGRYAYACKDIARMERDACYGMCITDYTY